MQQLNINKQQTQHTQCRKVFFVFLLLCGDDCYIIIYKLFYLLLVVLLSKNDCLCTAFEQQGYQAACQNQQH